MSETETTGSKLEAVKADTSRTLSSVHGLLALGCAAVVGLFGGGWAAFAQVRQVAHEEGKTAALAVVAGLPEKVDALTASVTGLREDAAEAKGELRGVREDFRIAFPRLPKLDGGQ